MRACSRSFLVAIPTRPQVLMSVTAHCDTSTQQQLSQLLEPLTTRRKLARKQARPCDEAMKLIDCHVLVRPWPMPSWSVFRLSPVGKRRACMVAGEARMYAHVWRYRRPPCRREHLLRWLLHRTVLIVVVLKRRDECCAQVIPFLRRSCILERTDIMRRHLHASRRYPPIEHAPL